MWPEAAVTPRWPAAQRRDVGSTQVQLQVCDYDRLAPDDPPGNALVPLVGLSEGR